MTHICVSTLTIIGSDNGLSPDRRQAIIWTNAGILLIGPLGTNFSEITIEILTFSFKKMRLKVSSAKRRPFCLGLNVLKCTVHSHSSRLGCLLITGWKMATALRTPFSKPFSCRKIVLCWLKFKWTLVTRVPINNMTSLVQIKASDARGNKPLSGPMMA